MSQNKDVFSNLAGNYLRVKLPSCGQEIEVRRLPFAVVMRLLSKTAVIVQAEISQYGDRVLEALRLSVSATAASPGERGVAFIGHIFPVVLELLTKAPDVLQTTLLDLLPDAAESDLALLSLEDGLAILIASFESADQQILTDQITSIFFGITGIVKRAVPVAATPPTVEPAKSPETLNAPSASQ